jgi:hypothetical protein
MPDVFTEQNYFDIFALATKAQRLANNLFVQDYERFNQGSMTDYTGYLKKDLTGETAHSTYISPSSHKGSTSFMSFINDYMMFGYYEKEEGAERMELDPRIDKDSKDGAEKKDPGAFSKFLTYFDAEFRQGSQFATFKVEHTGQVGNGANRR